LFFTVKLIVAGVLHGNIDQTLVYCMGTLTLVNS